MTEQLSYKRFNAQVKDVDGRGSGQLVVATMGVVDFDRDVTEPGFFGRQYVQLVPTHDWNHVPLGKGLLHERGNEAIVDFQFNLAIPAANDWFEAIKFDLENPPALQQYSYGFKVHPGGSRKGTFNGQQVQFLQPRTGGLPGAEVYEVSPVLRGAGKNTRTVSLAGSDDGLSAEQRRILEDIGKSVDREREAQEQFLSAYVGYLATMSEITS